MKKEMKVLKAQKTKLLNKECNTQEEFEELQERINQIEVEMLLAEK